MDRRKTTATGMRLGLAAAAIALVGTGGAFAQGTPTNGNLPKGAKPFSWDPTYGVCRGTDPACYHDWNPNRPDKVLIFSRTAGPRHQNLGTRLGPGLNPPLNANNIAQKALIDWLAAENIAADYTEDVTRIGSNYKAIIFLSNSREALWAHGRAVNPDYTVDTATSAYLTQGYVNLRKYVQGGGGFVAIHNAFGTEYTWPWYEGLLGGANYYNHGANQDGIVRIVGSADSATSGLPAAWQFKDEWYNLVPYPTNVKFLATVDESSLATQSSGHPGHGDFHPVAWCQYYDGGRVFATTLGHDGAAFTDGSGFPGQEQFKKLIVQGIKSAMGLIPFCTK